MGAVVGQRVCGDLIKPFPVQVIQTDIQRCRISVRLHYHVLDKGVGHRYIKPRTPRLNGKVERSHRIDAEECYALLDGLVIDDAKVFNNKLRESGLLQLPSPPRWPQRPDTLRTTTRENPDPTVTDERQSHCQPDAGQKPFSY